MMVGGAASASAQVPAQLSINNPGSSLSLLFPPGGNLPMGGFKFTGLGAGSASGDSLEYGQSGALFHDLSLTVPLAVVEGGSGTTTPSLVAGANVTVTGSWPDQTITASSGNYSIFDRLTGNPAFTASNTSSLQTMYSKNVPGGTLGSDGVLEIEFFGTYLNNSGGSVNLQIALTYGGTTFATTGTGLSIANSSTAYEFTGKLRLAALGATNAQGADGYFVIGVSTTPTGSSVWRSNSFYGGMVWGGSVDSTQAQTLALTALLGGAASNISISLYNVIVKQVQP